MPDLPSSDVIIVGAGIAGAAAGLELARQGVSFVGIDRASSFGGTALRGGVGTSIAGSPYQAEMGIEDDWELAARDLLADGNNPDPIWARFYFRRSAKDVFGWYRALGVTFERVTQHEGDSVARWHLPLGAGARVMGAAWEEFGKLGVQECWRFGLSVKDLLKDGDAVTGVEIEDGSRVGFQLPAKAVLLATGGFGANLQMCREVSPRFRNVHRLLSGGNPDSRGDLHRIVEQHGGQLTKMEDVYAYANGMPDYRDPSGNRGVVVRGMRSCIWVNRDGQRFHDEDLFITGRSAVDHLLGQPDQTCWLIIDEDALPEMKIQDHYLEPGTETPEQTARRFVENSPDFRKADSIEELAVATGLPAGALVRTIDEWNDLIRSGTASDPLTGRKLAGLRPLGEGRRWYSVQFFPLLRKTLGGVRTDLKCRVLDIGGRPVPGLFAAGELTGMGGGGMAGARPLEGLMAGGSLFSGYIAGRWAGRLLKRRPAPAA